MNELIKIEEKNNEQLVSARNLHEFLESKQDFTTWIKNRIEKYGFIENQDYLLHKFMEQLPTGSKYKHDYILKLDVAKEISMVEGNEKGKQARRYFIEIEKQFKAQTPSLSRKDLALMIIQSEEENEKLKLKTSEQQKQIEQLKPANEFVDKVFKQADTNIKIGDFAQVVKIADPEKPKTLIGQKKMFKLLRHLKILKGNNLPMQNYLEAGLFEVKERIGKQKEKEVIYLTTYVTPKGQTWLHKRLLEAVG